MQNLDRIHAIVDPVIYFQKAKINQLGFPSCVESVKVIISSKCGFEV